MRQLLQVSLAIVLAQCIALAATPARGANGVVLVGCDLFTEGGPKVSFIQSHGVSNDDDRFERRRFVGITGLRSEDFAGRDCAEILSEVLNDGLDFQAMVSSEDAGSALWFFQD